VWGYSTGHSNGCRAIDGVCLRYAGDVGEGSRQISKMFGDQGVKKKILKVAGGFEEVS
jgi:hypothetical protein